MAKRIQRRRIKSWQMPKNAVYVGRGSLFGNPYVCVMSPELAVAAFEEMLMGEKDRIGIKYIYGCDKIEAVQFYKCQHWLAELNKPLEKRLHLNSLRGKDLACWCPLDQPCHADVLLRQANEKEEKNEP